MKKQLSAMSIEELWQLFPIVLKEHNSRYKDWYETEKQQILKSIGAQNSIRINHIGSSAVENLIAKPTVDILLEIDGGCSVTQLTGDLKAAGWELMRQESDPVSIVFNKGYTPDGFADKVFHLHVRYYGDWNELYFRDYLMKYPKVAAEYGELKLRLWKEFEHNRDGYTDAKTDFITKYTNLAKQEFKDKYKPKV